VIPPETVEQIGGAALRGFPNLGRHSLSDGQRGRRTAREIGRAAVHRMGAERRFV